MKSGLKVGKVEIQVRSIGRNNLYRDEKRTESVEGGITKSGVDIVTTYTAMKSGLKVFSWISNPSPVSCNNLYRDEKRTESIETLWLSPSSFGNNLYRDEKRTESPH